MINNDKLSSWDDYMNNSLQDPDEASGYLEAAIEEYQIDGDAKYLMRAIQRIAVANGGISKLAQDTNLNRQNLYKIFSSQTSPRFDTFCKILNTLGFELCIKSFSHNNN